MNTFCTYFDRNYLLRGLALWESLRRAYANPRLYVLCLDEFTVRFLTSVADEGIKLIPLSELEAADRELAAVRPTRTRIEYYFSCTASLCLHILQRYPHTADLAYVDSDMYFFQRDPSFEAELASVSVGIVRHSLNGMPKEALHGLYNVGFVFFRNDTNARHCLEWWRAQCIEWCYDRVEPGRFADQKYLDEWPQRFDGIGVLAHEGVQVAPWNLHERDVACDGKGLRFGNAPLLIYHFHGLRWVSRNVVRPTACPLSVPWSTLTWIYLPYLDSVRNQARLHDLDPTRMNSARGPPRTGPLLTGLLNHDLLLIRPRILSRLTWRLSAKAMPPSDAFRALIQAHQEENIVLTRRYLLMAVRQRPCCVINPHLVRIAVALLRSSIKKHGRPA
jgi:hypothetical protein